MAAPTMTAGRPKRKVLKRIPSFLEAFDDGAHGPSCVIDCLFYSRSCCLVINPGGVRNLAHEQLSDTLQHLLLPERQVPLLLEEDQLSKDDGNLIERSCLDPLQVIFEPAVPVRADFQIVLLKDCDHLRDVRWFDDLSKAHPRGVFRGDHTRHPASDNSKNVKGLSSTRDVFFLDGLDQADAVSRVHHFCADAIHT